MDDGFVEIPPPRVHTRLICGRVVEDQLKISHSKKCSTWVQTQVTMDIIKVSWKKCKVDVWSMCIVSIHHAIRHKYWGWCLGILHVL
jgi:hypothetical protein